MIIDGKKIQQEHLLLLKKMTQTKLYVLDIIYVGQNSVIEKYINAKKQLGLKIGVQTRIHTFDEHMLLEDLKETIKTISKDSSGIIVQLPLPKHLPKIEVLEAIPPFLDVDLLTDRGYKNFLTSSNKRYPPVLRACMYILESHTILLKNKKICILGSGKLVGTPIKDWCVLENLPYKQMTKENFNPIFLKEADIIFSGMGAPHFVTTDMVKEGVIVFDAGTTEEGGSVFGDIHPDVSKKATFFTPVPGGIGPLTVLGLFHNLVEPY